MKSVLFLKSAPAVPVMGADISMFERFRLLKPYGWEGSLCSTARSSHRGGLEKVLKNLDLKVHGQTAESLMFSRDGINCSIHFGENADTYAEKSWPAILTLFAEALQQAHPDMLFVNGRDLPALRFAADEQGRPFAAFVTEDEYPKAGAPGTEEFLSGIKKASAVIVASEYLARSLKESSEVDCSVIANAVDLNRYAFEKPAPGRYITLLHPYAHKGVDLFLQLAREMPERDFLLVQGSGAEYRGRKEEFLRYSNITLHEFTSDVRSVYKESRIVLIPSLWQEGFSRVILEAFASGTPVIASDKGGMRSAGGDALICVPAVQKEGGFDCAPWISEIVKFDNPDYLHRAAESAKSRVDQYRDILSHDMDKLSKLMGSLCERG